MTRQEKDYLLDFIYDYNNYFIIDIIYKNILDNDENISGVDAMHQAEKIFKNIVEKIEKSC